MYLYFLNPTHLTKKVVGNRFKRQIDTSLHFALRHFPGALEPTEPFQLSLCCSTFKETLPISSSTSERTILPY